MRDRKRKKSVTTKQILKHVTGKAEALPLINLNNVSTYPNIYR
jgi:hypothetical protein